MKKTLLSVMTATLLFGNHAMATKVTYDDAVASSSGFYEANNAVNKAPSTNGLGDREKPSTSSANQIGKWVKVSSSLSNTASAGEYASMLSPSAAGQNCLVGDKGMIMGTQRVCVDYDSNYNNCDLWETQVTTTKGYKAECR